MMKLLKRKFFYRTFIMIRWIPGYFGRKIRNYCVRNYILSSGKNIDIGINSSISRNVVIGENSGVGARSVISNHVFLGDNVMIGPEVIIYTNNHNFSRIDIPMNSQGMSEIKKVEISNDVWIGARVIILPGVKIGQGSVIGAGAIVAKDIPSYSIAIGNPVKIIKSRK